VGNFFTCVFTWNNLDGPIPLGREKVMGAEGSVLVSKFRENPLRFKMRRVAGQDRIGTDQFFELLKDPAFERQVFRGGFDNQVRPL